MVIHKHPVIFVHVITGFALIFILPLIGALWAWFHFLPLASYGRQGLIAGVCASLYFLYGLLFFCIQWINEEFDVFIITSERLIDITQISFFKRSVASAPLEHIQDTIGLVNGFLPSLFKYGDLTIKTASGQATEFFMDYVPDPEGAARKILEWAQKKKGHKKEPEPA